MSVAIFAGLAVFFFFLAAIISDFIADFIPLWTTIYSMIASWMMSVISLACALYALRSRFRLYYGILEVIAALAIVFVSMLLFLDVSLKEAISIAPRIYLPRWLYTGLQLAAALYVLV
jgi:hypothetical protein